MKIAQSSYELKPKSGKPPRWGALLRVESKDGIGYADLHPWPELGDLPLERQLAELREGRLTSLTRNSLRFARLDAEARARGVSLFEGLKIPESHFLITDLEKADSELAAHVREQGFSRVKIKVGRNGAQEARHLQQLCEWLGPGIALRLDFNALLNEGELEAWLDRARDLLDRVDWIEDPLKWSPLSWKKLREKWGVRLASDWEGEGVSASLLNEAADLRVIKPAAQGREWEAYRELPLVFTSYLDHPVGQLCAAYEAATAVAQGARIECCGLISHPVYAANTFSEQLRTQGPFLLPAEGPGLGFGDLLENLDWKELA